MKHLSIKLLVTVVAIVLSTNLSATNPLGITNGNSATFEEVKAVNTTIELCNLIENSFALQLFSMEEIKLKVQVENNDPNTTATATIMVVSNDGVDELGPYSISEGEILLVTIDQREWSVQEIQSSEGAVITSWY